MEEPVKTESVATNQVPAGMSQQVLPNSGGGGDASSAMPASTTTASGIPGEQQQAHLQQQQQLMMQGQIPHFPPVYAMPGAALPVVAAPLVAVAASAPPPHPAPTTSGRGRGKHADPPGPQRFKKAPDAPKRFKSAFIIFSAEKHREIKEQHAREGRTEKTTDIAKKVSEAWREMKPEEKELWEKRAQKDKARYEVEKSMYKGPWKIQANKRTPKDPSAPKRPMSAFLAFSNKRRAALKREYPNATNADLSKMLSKTWKEAPEDVRRKYMEEEAGLREKYKVEMGGWRKRVAEEKKMERQEREAVAMQTAEARSMGMAGGIVPMDPNSAAAAAGMPMTMPGQQPMGSNNPATANGADANSNNPAGSMQQGMYPFMMPPGGDMQQQFNPMMGNPFASAAQYGMPGAMQLQLSQMIAGQQFLQNQRGALGLYGQGLPEQGTPSEQQMAPGMQQNPELAGFGSMDPNQQQQSQDEQQQQSQPTVPSDGQQQMQQTMDPQMQQQQQQQGLSEPYQDPNNYNNNMMTNNTVSAPTDESGNPRQVKVEDIAMDHSMQGGSEDHGEEQEV